METLSPETPGRLFRFWRYSRTLLAPLLIWLLLVGFLFSPVISWLHREESYDEAAMQEWLEESRNPDKTLADLVAEYQGTQARRQTPARN